MWQSFLKERFGMVAHKESKESQIRELVIGKNGPKLKETTLGPDAPPPAPGTPLRPQLDKNGVPEMNAPGLILMISDGTGGVAGHAVGRAQTMTQLADSLANQLNNPVIDRTGLTGRYDFNVEFTPDLGGALREGLALVRASQAQGYSG